MSKIFFPLVFAFPLASKGQDPGMNMANKKPAEQPVQKKIKIDTMFFDKDWHHLPDRANASFYRAVKKVNSKYYIEDRYINNSIQMKAFCPSGGVDLQLNGRVTYYNQNGFIVEDANYKDDKLHGKNLWYNKNESDSTVGYYDNGRFLYNSVNSKYTEKNNNDGNDGVDEVPYLKQGVPNLHDVIQKGIEIPGDLKSKKFSVKTFIEFTVTVNGDVENVKVKHSSGELSLDNEALRIVKSLPKFVPGKRQGTKIPVALVVPVVFVN